MKYKFIIDGSRHAAFTPDLVRRISSIKMEPLYQAHLRDVDPDTLGHYHSMKLSEIRFLKRSQNT